MSESPLEQLLRETALKHGRIALDSLGGGRWAATVVHFNGHMTHPMGDYHDDPVDALRAALIEDERRGRDLERRYRDAPKVGDVPAPGSPYHLALEKRAGVDAEFDAEDGTCIICESGGSGCDVCRPVAADDMEDLLG